MKAIWTVGYTDCLPLTAVAGSVVVLLHQISFKQANYSLDIQQSYVPIDYLAHWCKDH